MDTILKDKIPSKKLVQESFEILELLNSQEYRELQNKFDSLYSQIKQEQLMMLQIVGELKLCKNSFIKKNSTESESLKIDDLNSLMDKLTKNIKNKKSHIKHFTLQPSKKVLS